MTAEFKQKVSVAKKGNKYWVGKKHSEESRKKISEKIKGKYIGRTPTWLVGRTLSDEHKQKDREAILGLKYWNNGIKNVRARECPEGFVKGFLTKRKRREHNVLCASLIANLII